MAVESAPKPTIPFIQELNPSNPNLVKQYIHNQPDKDKDASYNELIGCLVPEEYKLYKQRDANDPKNQELMSYALQRKQNLESILRNKNIPGNLTAMFNQLPTEALSKVHNDDLIPLLSPLEQKVLKGTGVKTEGDEDSDNFLIKQSLLSLAYNRQKQKEYEASVAESHPTKTTPLIIEAEPEVLQKKEEIPEKVLEKIPEKIPQKSQPIKFIQELNPPNPNLVKQYIQNQPAKNKDASYNELIGCLVPEEYKLYKQRDANDPKNQELISNALQRKQNLESILRNKNIPGNLTAMFNQLPTETLTNANNDELVSLLSPLEQKVLKGTKSESEGDEGLDNFLIRQSLLSLAYNRQKQKEYEASVAESQPSKTHPLIIEEEIPEKVLEKTPEKSQPIKFIQELDPTLDPNLVNKYINKFAEDSRVKVYNNLLGYLTPEESRIYHINVEDPSNINLLSLALQRKQNLEKILNNIDIPNNYTEMFAELPSEVLSDSNNDELVSLLSPSEKKILGVVSKKAEMDASLEAFLVKQSILSIAYNRQRQMEYEASLKEKQPVELLPLEPAVITQPETVKPLSFIQELNPPEPKLVGQFINKSPEENREKVYNELLQYLMPEENRLYHMNVNDPRNINLLSLALQRKQNLEIIFSNMNIPDNFSAIYRQLPDQVLSEPNNEELLFFLSPAERQQFDAVTKKDGESETLEKVLARHSLLAIAYNRQRQKEYEDSIAKTQPIKLTPEKNPS